MSRRHQPPLPPGPPPRQHNDSYRPSNQNRDMYVFGGSSNSYRPSYDDRSYNERSSYNYAPGRGPEPEYRSQRLRSPHYRSRNDGHGPPQDDFSFRHNAPPSIANNYDDYRRDVTQSRQSQYNHNFRTNGGQAGQRGGYRGRAGPRLASDRAFLKTNREPTPELLPGMLYGSSDQVKFLPIGDVSDSSEAEMDFSNDDNSQDEDGQPKKKQARTSKRAADGDSVPKWSNPDPYTALPPPDAERKKDIVKLIKKARVDVGNAGKSEVAAADDFISFDMDGNGEDESDIMAGAPTGPRADDYEPSPPSLSQNLQSRSTRDPSCNSFTPINKVTDATSNPELGSRKRTIRDEIKETPTLRQALATNKTYRDAPIIQASSKGKKPPSKGLVTNEWFGKFTPWIVIDHSDTANMGLRLHKEIMDFYDYVKPRNFEGFIRAKLVEDLQDRVSAGYKGAEIHTFGSFPAGLYLPTADMDLVCVSDVFMNGGYKNFGQSTSSIRRFGQWLEKQGKIQGQSLEMITKARVPLVKYVDKVTGLKVDISFENDTGLIANKTFQDWKATYPAMPIIVTLVKHLLVMRGLNEPVNGGIGGFSVICLVVSLLQHMPQAQARNMIPEHNLGEVLMEFFDLYGNRFNWLTTAIQFDPPGYVSKAHLDNLPYNKKNADSKKICIIDPNNPSNDISGGSSNTRLIIKCFSDAYVALQKRMGDLQYGQYRNESILACILEGNYRSFQLQRDHLAHLHECLYGPVN